MSRRNARKNAFVLLFQMEFNAAEEQEQMTDLFFAEQDEVVTEEDKAYMMLRPDSSTIFFPVFSSCSNRR